VSDEAPIAELKDVTVTQSGRPSPELDHFSLAIAAREVVVMLGEHGSGKEAVLRVLAQAPAREDNVSGVLSWRGAGSGRRERNAVRVAWLPSPGSRPLSPHADAASQLVRIVARKLSIPRAGALAELRGAVAKLKGAPAFETFEKKPAALSQTELAWGLLAATVAQTPDLVLADHAVGDLGPTSARALTLALLEEQKRLGFALLYASGTLNVASWLGGRIVVMNHGRAIEQGPVERLASAQTHAYTQMLFKTLPKLSTEKPPRTIARGETLLRVQGLDLVAEKDAQKRPREGLTFELRRGAALALVGEEGSGRRALARAILGLDHPPQGRVLLDAVDLSILSETMTSRLRRRMAFITGADDALDPRMTLWDTVDEPLRAHLKLPSELTAGYRDAALKRVGLASLDGRRAVGTLAAFEKRRLQVARAMVSAPLLAVIDEPLRGLDAFAQAVMRDLLTDFRKQEGPAFLVITADFTVAQALADEAMILKDRRVVERGPIHEIIRAPKEAYTKGLIDAVGQPFPLALPEAAS
jgi:peptide/nickel transport system ATP-binding protein